MNDINYWQQKIAQEHEARMQAETQAQEALKKLAALQELLKKNIAYKNYLESKNSELQTENKTLNAKFSKVATMLKQAKQLIVLRKSELAKLRHDNSKLTQELSAKSELLTVEMLQNEELNQKLARALNLHARAIEAHSLTTVEDNDFAQQLRYIGQQHMERHLKE